MNEIRECPFCGSEPTFGQTNREANRLPNGTVVKIEHSMKCETCGYEFGREETIIVVLNNGEIEVCENGYKNLVDRWNRRVEEPHED